MGRALPPATPPTSTETVFLRAGPFTPPNIPSRALRDAPCRAVRWLAAGPLPAGDESIFIRLSPISHPGRLCSSWTHTFLEEEHHEDLQAPDGRRGGGARRHRVGVRGVSVPAGPQTGH